MDLTDVTKQAEREQRQNPRFISRYPIFDHYTLIRVPEDATLLRTKGRYVKFYIGQEPEGSRNGWSSIPQGVKAVFFPGFREVSGQYGEPQFEKSYRRRR